MVRVSAVPIHLRDAITVDLPAKNAEVDFSSVPYRHQRKELAYKQMIEATDAMVAYFEKRTRMHIDRVRDCLSIVSAATGIDLAERAETHDASKFVEPERTPYIWLTEYHRCRDSQKFFVYPDGMEQRVREAIRHHVTSNRHHPECHPDANAMSDVDLIEMVCDWTAMAMERVMNCLVQSLGRIARLAFACN
jgi:hypothetical protein